MESFKVSSYVFLLILFGIGKFPIVFKNNEECGEREEILEMFQISFSERSPRSIQSIA